MGIMNKGWRPNRNVYDIPGDSGIKRL